MGLTQITTGGVDDNINIDSNTLKVDGTNNRVGIGTSAPATPLDLQMDSVSGIKFDVRSGGGSEITTYQGSSNSNVRTFQINSSQFIVETGAPQGATTTERFKIDSSGNVGIAETAPQAKLHVKEGNSGVTPDSNRDTLFLEAAGNAGITIGTPNSNTGYLAFGDPEDENAGQIIYRHASNSMSAFTAGTERMRIDSSGRLLVGTTSTSATCTSVFAGRSDGANDPVLRLEVNSTAPANGTALGGLNFASSGLSGFQAGARIAAVRDGGTWTNGSSHPTYFEFATTADGASSPTERMRIDSSGNVGIGTTSPSELLHVSGTSNPSFQLTSTNDTTPAIKWSTNSVDRLLIDSSSVVGARVMVRSNQQLSFGTNNTERMRIDNSGNVGIGTTSPSSKFDVEIASNTGINFTNQGAAPILDFKANSVESAGRIRAGEASGGGVLQFATKTTGGTITEAFRIDTSQRLLVGTSSAASVQQIQAANTGGENFGAFRFANNTGPSDIALHKSRGSLGSHTIVQNNDAIGSIAFRGSDGSAFRNAATINGEVDGTPGSSDMPGRLVFATSADGTSSPTERMRITSTGQMRLAGAGITFNGDTATANELDDYEEGTYTVTISNFTTTGTVTTTGQYVKVGKQVTVGIKVASTGTIGYGVSCNISLPFAMTSGNEANGLIGMLLNNNASAQNSNINGVQCKLDGEGGARFFVGNFTTTSTGQSLLFGGTYIAAS